MKNFGKIIILTNFYITGHTVGEVDAQKITIRTKIQISVIFSKFG